MKAEDGINLELSGMYACPFQKKPELTPEGIQRCAVAIVPSVQAFQFAR